MPQAVAHRAESADGPLQLSRLGREQLPVDARLTVRRGRPYLISTGTQLQLANRALTQRGDLIEFACHEGNYGLRGILSATREEERRAREGDR